MSHVLRAALKLTLRRATEGDAASIACLINRAYRVERFFIEGDRTSESEVLKLQRGDGFFLILERSQVPRNRATATASAKAIGTERPDSGKLAAAIYVRGNRGDCRGYFGLLSTAPELQGTGLGRRMIAVAEALCEAGGCTTMDIQVVNLRTELQPWYRSLGYRACGTKAFEDSVALKQACHFVLMEKRISPDRYI